MSEEEEETRAERINNNWIRKLILFSYKSALHARRRENVVVSIKRLPSLKNCGNRTHTAVERESVYCFLRSCSKVLNQLTYTRDASLFYTWKLRARMPKAIQRIWIEGTRRERERERLVFKLIARCVCAEKRSYPQLLRSSPRFLFVSCFRDGDLFLRITQAVIRSRPGAIERWARRDRWTRWNETLIMRTDRRKMMTVESADGGDDLCFAPIRENCVKWSRSETPIDVFHKHRPIISISS